MVLRFQVTPTITMGKMKRGRQKAHSAAVKLKAKSNDNSVEVVDMEQDTKSDQVSSPFPSEFLSIMSQIPSLRTWISHNCYCYTFIEIKDRQR